jgi:hypothetical protein
MLCLACLSGYTSKDPASDESEGPMIGPQCHSVITASAREGDGRMDYLFSDHNCSTFFSISLFYNGWGEGVGRDYLSLKPLCCSKTFDLEMNREGR